ncbi:MAG TPA: transporter substrate-binding domain-containing protein [Geminicoccaceae bacterium]
MLLSRRRLAVVLLAATAAFPAGAATLDDIASRGAIRIAVPQDFPPFGSVGPDLQPRGYDIDMARLIAERLGVKAELTPVTSANRLPYLQTRKVDLVISSLGKNPEREKAIDFTAACAPFFSGVFGAAALPVSDPAGLAGKTVAVTRGALEDLELSKLVPADAVIKRYEDNNTTMTAFLSGQVELIATGNTVAAAILARNPPVKPETKFIIKSSPCHIGLNKDEPALLAKVNEIIAAAKADGALDALSKKWLGQPLPADLPS